MSHHNILALCFANTGGVVHTAQSLLVLALVFPVFHYRQSSRGRRGGVISSISRVVSNGKIGGHFVSLKLGQEKISALCFLAFVFPNTKILLN